MNRPRCILFDFWNTIARSSLNHVGAMAAYLTAAEAPPGLTVEDVQEAAAELYTAAKAGREEAGWEVSREQFDRHVAARLGLSFRHSREELDRIFVRGALNPQVEPGSAAALKELAEMRLKIGLLSNSVLSGVVMAEILEKLGLRQYFAFVMTSADYGFRKPQLQLFKTALALAGALPSETWFVGDGLSQDIAGAMNAGMFAVWYNPAGKAAEGYKPDLTLTFWEDLPAAVKRSYSVQSIK